jgi:ABC-type polysaccharide/polyol phosphate transport system ATPase subunit
MIGVRFEDVSKRYRLRHSSRRAGRRDQEFWAVRNVRFDVQHGETVGVIGHNGAGKSTILKLLSRITAPTTGTITLHGHLAALIELGSGFHPELTGRENIFLSGSILGMKRREIAQKLDRIIAFSGIERFVDMPVKWYSSGMFVRLGFSVAAHLEADILLVDEVLGVGDAAFQIRCYERIAELRRAGTTMLFISHDLGSIEKLSDRVMLMDHGRLVASGPPREIVRQYQQLVASTYVCDLPNAVVPSGSGAVRISDVRFLQPDGREIFGTCTGDPLRAVVDIDVASPVHDAVVEVFYYSRDGRTLHCQQSTAVSGDAVTLLPGRRRLEFTCEAMGLQPGLYSIGASVRESAGAGIIDWWYAGRVLAVEPGKSVRGYFYAPHEWRWADAGSAAEHHPADV